MTKKYQLHLANLNRRCAIELFRSSMDDANVSYIGTTGRMTIRMETAWKDYVEACKRLVELGKTN